MKKKCNYKIILAMNNKQIEFIKAYCKVDSAVNYFNKLIEENKKVIFPVQFVNTKAIKDVTYKLVLLKKKDYKEETSGRFKNEYGEFVDHETSNKDWIVYNIENYNLEEKFWVYGYHPFRQRKTFEWIYDNFIKTKANDKYSFLNIILFKNKVLFDAYDKTEMVICKNKNDAVRMYNLVEEWCQRDKFKYVMFSGDADSRSTLKKRKIIEKIQSFTHWSSKKIRRYNTRP